MPLRAQLDGRSINAVLLSETEWQALKGSRLLRMPCCDAPAYRRTSRLGTRHFAHSPKHHCGTEGESAEHLAAKAEIVRVCHDLGWNADSEVAEGQWRADVLATRDRHRLAFEVQWSTQTLDATRERQAGYGTDVKCCWLFRKLPTEQRPHELHPTLPERNLPMFRLQLADSGFNVTVDHNNPSLREFVTARLAGRIRFRDHREYVCELQVVTHETGCWRCGASYDLFYTRQVMRSSCGAEEMRDPGDCDTEHSDPYSALRNVRLAQRHFPSELKRLRFSVARRGSTTMERSYWSFGCPRCDALFGSHYFHHLMAEPEDAELVPFCSKILPRSEHRREPHWCFPQNGRFC